MIYVLKYLGISILMSSVYFEMHKCKEHKWMARYMIKQSWENLVVPSRWWVYKLALKFLQLSNA
jgi:hypothetical protein